MKVKLYKKWIRFVVYHFDKHYLYKLKNGKYLLAERIWHYAKHYPNGALWLKDLVEEFKLKYLKA